MNSGSDKEKLSPQRQMAEELALELGGYKPIPGLADDLDDYLSPTQSLLTADAFGLCKGLSTGMITSSQPRIASNLLRVAEELAREPDSSRNQAVISVLNSIVSRAATFGLTADNSQLPGLLTQRRR